MKKFDRNSFLSEFFKTSKVIPDDNLTLQLDSLHVTEKYNNKKYQYSVYDPDLKDIQQRMLTGFLESIEINNAAMAFRKNYSYLNFLEAHKNGYFFLRLDISSFFHSIPFNVLEDIFSAYFDDVTIDDAHDLSLLDIFLSYVTHEIPESSPNKDSRGKKIVPMGFVTSPAISNIVFRRVDINIQKFCLFHNIKYTRYADDLLFSSDRKSSFLHSDLFEREISILVSLLGLKLNSRKTLRKNHTISLNGYTIQNSGKSPFSPYNSGFVHISNKKTEIIGKLIHKISVEGCSHLDIMKKLFKFHMRSKISEKPIKTKTLEKYASNQLFNKLAGYRSYLISIIHFDKKYNCIASKPLEKYSQYIDKINKIMDQWPS